VSCLVQRLQTAAAEAIDRGAADGARQAGQQGDDPANIKALFFLLLGVAEDDVFNRRGIDAGPLDDGANDRGGEIVGTNVAKDAALRMGPPNRRPAAVNDYWSFHGVGISLLLPSPFFVSFVCFVVQMHLTTKRTKGTKR
jgi:hypothetical protein